MHPFRVPTLCSFLTLALCACGDSVVPVDEALTRLGTEAQDARDPKAPVLSDEPLWQVEYDPSYPEGCFGRSVALGDLNGDGQRDLVVAAPPCLTTTRAPGRVSIYAGEAPFFSKQGLTTVMNWRSPLTRAHGSSMVVSTGNVDGDAYADVLVSGQYGALVFRGGPDLGAVFAQPAFFVPGTSTFYNSVLSDVNGDGLDDLVSARPVGMAVYLATPGAATGPFTLAVRTQPLFSTLLRRVGDLTGDGAADLILQGGSGFQALFRGCKPGSPFACDGSLARQPLWVVETRAFGLLPDLNGDGSPERLQGPGGGSVQLHLSDAQSPSLYAAAPVWSMMGDPVFSLFGNVTASAGDMDGDGQRNDFVVGSDGRLYLYSPAQGVSGDLTPLWAWPRADRLPSNYEGYHRFSVQAPGDLDGNGFDDLVVGMAPPAGLVSGPAGRVAVLGGGEVPHQPKTPPYLPGVAACGLQLDPAAGKPDLMVDSDVLARSMYVERRTFAPDACELQEACVGGPGERKLLRFSTSIVNLGGAAATVPNVQERPDLYEFDVCHRHDHLVNFARYTLRDSRGAEAVAGRKQGFYLVDYHRQCSDAAPYFLYGVRMGISPGWSDIYMADIPCQWIDITGLKDGRYTLRVGVDEQDIIEEADVLPNASELDLLILGDSVSVLPIAPANP